MVLYLYPLPFTLPCRGLPTQMYYGMNEINRSQNTRSRGTPVSLSHKFGLITDSKFSWQGWSGHNEHFPGKAHLLFTTQIRELIFSSIESTFWPMLTCCSMNCTTCCLSRLWSFSLCDYWINLVSITTVSTVLQVVKLAFHLSQLIVGNLGKFIMVLLLPLKHRVESMKPSLVGRGYRCCVP